MFESARISVMLSKSDGFPAALKESVLYGAVPIMARTSCAGEVLGSQGGLILVDPPLLDSLVAAVRVAMADQCPVDEWTSRSRTALRGDFADATFLSLVKSTYALVGQER